MTILAIETSCDETAAAVSRNGREILSSCVASQADIHELYGGVVPEIASRRHIECVVQIAERAISDAGIDMTSLDAIAVTYAPGLIGALLVGVGFAKALSFALDLPLVPVHHIRGHIAANLIAFPELEPPFLCLVASGGHTQLIDVRDYTDFRILGETRDDAAGEAFDKCARMLGFGYPGGAELDKLAQGGDDKKYPLPRASIDGSSLDMSFSGLKTAVINLIHNIRQKGEEPDAKSVAASFSAAVSDVLVPRAIEAAKTAGRSKLAVAGGVAANSRIRSDLTRAAAKHNISLYLPPIGLCGDNAAMIACQAYYELLAGNTAGSDLNAYATMPCDELVR
ncbi:MAG: tRNA (adenosine(37)-N6)-threonylcarbamoyltransferase complex transferase subunit TsaD [Clostridiales bacterium]|nr:tRNA (adenosine(37)-N6)-threonylcarbamoyltransferase complex transferase subunit TsaD [Clostridiales bacterium]